jgi:hypothetical protein
MGSDFYIYETKSDDKGDLIEIERVLYLSNTQADIIYNYFSDNYGSEITYNNNLYYECYFDVLYDLYKHLKIVLSKNGLERDIRAMFYFPPRSKIPDWTSGTEMFSESYYSDLEIILERLDKVIYRVTDNSEDNGEFSYLNGEREFLYHFER